MAATFLPFVQPQDGWIAIVGITSGNDVRQILCSTYEDAEDAIDKLKNQNRNVYFGVAKYKDGTSRVKDNVLALKAFWVDLDCGEDKAVVNATTGRPKGYIDQTTAITALRKFCKDTSLPIPYLVNSGRGIHAYWVMDRDLTREEWEPVTAKFKELCYSNNLHADPSVFEAARILRVPNTVNYKSDPPLPVSVLRPAAASGFAAFCTLVGYTPAPEATAPASSAIPGSKGRRRSALGGEMAKHAPSSFEKILRVSREGKGCAQLLDCYDNQATLSEPRWFDALSIVKSCEDSDRYAQEISRGHPDYTPEKTELKMKGAKGPHSCEVIEKENPGGCDGCAFKGKITNPLALGRVVVEAETEDATVVQNDLAGNPVEYAIPKYPHPYFRPTTGGIYKHPDKPEGEPEFVYEHDLYVVRRMRDPVLGDVVVMRLHMPHDGVSEFVVPNIKLTDKAELRKILAMQGVIASEKRLILITDYLYRAVRELQRMLKAELMRLQFGWADNDRKFILGSKEITPDGIFHSPTSSTTEVIASRIGTAGTFEKWKEVFALYGRPGMEPNAFATLSAFGAPLFRFTGQSGAIINMISSVSGTGKTTVLQMINSVYGHPSKLCAIKEDTLNSKMHKLGTLNNLPFTMDEITNMPPNDLSNMVYNMTQGTGKDRMKQSTNEMRVNATSWRTVSVCSSNVSIYEKLLGLKKNPDGETMRLMEIKLAFNGAIDRAEGKNMFDHVLVDNYGHAGEIYLRYIVNNLDTVRELFLKVQASIDKHINITQRERFWSSLAAANITGGFIAKYLGIIDWDMQVLKRWVENHIIALRDEVHRVDDDPAAILGAYINEHMQNVLVINNKKTSAGMMQLPVMEPRGELLVRFEPDTKRMYIASGPFKEACIKFQTNYRDVLNELQLRGIMIGTEVKRMSKGTSVNAPGVHALVMDCSNNEFIKVDDAVGTDAGGED